MRILKEDDEGCEAPEVACDIKKKNSQAGDSDNQGLYSICEWCVCLCAASRARGEKMLGDEKEDVDVDVEDAVDMWR